MTRKMEFDIVIGSVALTSFSKITKDLNTSRATVMSVLNGE